MVSPFLSFLGGVAEAHRGALQEVRASRAKKQELEETRAAEQAIWESRTKFQERLKREAAEKEFGRKKDLELFKNAIDSSKRGTFNSLRPFMEKSNDLTLGRWDKVPGDKAQELTNQWTSLARFGLNQENVDALRNDSDAYAKFRQELRALVNTTQTQFRVGPTGEEQYVDMLASDPATMATAPYQILQNSDFLRQEYQKLQGSNVFTSEINPKTIARSRTDGRQILRDDKGVIDRAIKKFQTGKAGFSSKNAYHAVADRLDRAFGRYDPNLSKEPNSYYKALNSSLGDILLSKERDVTSEEAEAGLADILNHFTRNGELQVENLVRFVGVAHNDTHGIATRASRTSGPMTVGIENKRSGGQIAKLITEERNKFREAGSLVRNLTALKSTKLELNAGGELVIGFKSFVAGFPDVVKGLVGTLYSALGSKDSPLSDSARNYIGKKLEAISKMDQTTQDGILAARAETLKITIAYQLAIVNQGTGGGKTISDEDVARQERSIGGSFNSLGQAVAKIDTLLDDVQQKRAISGLYQSIQSTDNIGRLHAARKVEAMLSRRGFGSVNYEARLNDAYQKKLLERGVKEPIPSSNIGTPNQMYDNIKKEFPESRITYPVIQKFWETSMNKVNKFPVRMGRMEEGNRVILFNRTAADQWAANVERQKRGLITPNQLKKSSTELRELAGFGIDIRTGSIYPMRYRQSGTVTTLPRRDSTGKVISNSAGQKITGTPAPQSQEPINAPPTTPDVRGGYDINAYRRMFNKLSGNSAQQ